MSRRRKDHCCGLQFSSGTGRERDWNFKVCSSIGRNRLRREHTESNKACALCTLFTALVWYTPFKPFRLNAIQFNAKRNHCTLSNCKISFPRSSHCNFARGHTASFCEYQSKSAKNSIAFPSFLSQFTGQETETQDYPLVFNFLFRIHPFVPRCLFSLCWTSERKVSNNDVPQV